MTTDVTRSGSDADVVVHIEVEEEFCRAEIRVRDTESARDLAVGIVNALRSEPVLRELFRVGVGSSPEAGDGAIRRAFAVVEAAAKFGAPDLTIAVRETMFYPNMIPPEVPAHGEIVVRILPRDKAKSGP